MWVGIFRLGGNLKVFVTDRVDARDACKCIKILKLLKLMVGIESMIDMTYSLVTISGLELLRMIGLEDTLDDQ